jgi:phosphate/sulfate permease
VGAKTLTLRQAVLVRVLNNDLWCLLMSTNDNFASSMTQVGAWIQLRAQIAAIFEFVGAMVLGRVSTSVIASGIADAKVFAREPEVLAYGMVCAMTVSGIWQIVASYFELNVSSTHSIIGSIIGFALVYGGSDAITWDEPDPTSFPPVKVHDVQVCWKACQSHL